MANRATPESPAGVGLTEAEVAILDRLAGVAGVPARPAVSHHLVAVAKLGGLPGAGVRTRSREI